MAKITNKINVDNILSKKKFTHEGIYLFEKEIKKSDLIFFVFSGDKAKIDWEQGLVGFGEITKAPYDKGYNTSNSRYFRIDIQPTFVLSRPLEPKFTKLHPKYQNELYDVPYVGANHFPNQAISRARGDGAKALFCLMRDIDPISVSDLDYDFLDKTAKVDTNTESVKEKFRIFLSKKNKKSTVSSYINALDNLPEYLNNKGIDCPSIWSFSVDLGILQNVADIVKGESGKELGGLLCDYKPKSDWNNGWFYSGVNNYVKFISEFAKNKNESFDSTSLPKPFLLLAGISGTGKTRFVLDQARRSNGWSETDSQKPNNYELVAVRPDWHEPSDLLGYVSRIDGIKYVPTKFLFFLIAAWQEVFDCGGSLVLIGENTRPFWLCLDEMNLAPVEQYFADYLSILESRKWNGSGYSSLPLVAEHIELAMKSLGGSKEDPVWKAFLENDGIPIPPNFIVAGTVNMDETTHGFSRKVIDRALTFDFQEFFPNDYDAFFEGQKEPNLYSFPVRSEAKKSDLPEVDADGKNSKSVEFLKKINTVLKNTPFELAYRALNELLLSVVCFSPENNEELQAVWDDFLMQKVLPRIEGDSQKLKFIQEEKTNFPESEGLKAAEKIYGKGSILHQLFALLEKDLLKDIWDGADKRPDLLRDTEEKIECRSRKKLFWMMKRLKSNHFTDFWV